MGILLRCKRRKGGGRGEGGVKQREGGQEQEGGHAGGEHSVEADVVGTVDYAVEFSGEQAYHVIVM